MQGYGEMDKPPKLHFITPSLTDALVIGLDQRTFLEPSHADCSQSPILIDSIARMFKCDSSVREVQQIINECRPNPWLKQ